MAANRYSGQVTSGGAIRESLPAEGPLQQEGDRAPALEEARSWGSAKACGGMMLHVLSDPRQRQGTWSRVVQARRERCDRKGVGTRGLLPGTEQGEVTESA